MPVVQRRRVAARPRSGMAGVIAGTTSKRAGPDTEARALGPTRAAHELMCRLLAGERHEFGAGRCRIVRQNTRPSPPLMNSLALASAAWITLTRTPPGDGELRF